MAANFFVSPLFPFEHRIHWKELILPDLLKELPLEIGLLPMWYARLMAMMQVWDRRHSNAQRWLPHSGVLHEIRLPWAENLRTHLEFQLLGDRDLYDYLYIRYLYRVTSITGKHLNKCDWKKAELCFCRRGKRILGLQISRKFIPPIDSWLEIAPCIPNSGKSRIRGRQSIQN